MSDDGTVTLKVREGMPEFKKLVECTKTGVCGTCRHFRADMLKLQIPRVGICVCHPPQAVVFGTQGGKLKIEAVWPPMRADQDCGEWREKGEGI